MGIQNETTEEPLLYSSSSTEISSMETSSTETPSSPPNGGWLPGWLQNKWDKLSILARRIIYLCLLVFCCCCSGCCVRCYRRKCRKKKDGYSPTGHASVNSGFAPWAESGTTI